MRKIRNASAQYRLLCQLAALIVLAMDCLALRIKSLAVAAPSIEQLCTKFAARLKEAKPDALLWLTDSQQTAAVAKVASRACGASIGARTDAGLIGGGNGVLRPAGRRGARRGAGHPKRRRRHALLQPARRAAGARRLGFVGKRAAGAGASLIPSRRRRRTPDSILKAGSRAWIRHCRGRRRSAASSAATASS